MFFCYITIYLVGSDIAFNKPAEASSVYNDQTGSYGPQYVNNGKADCSHPSGPMAHTNIESNPWFKVDLQGTFYIETVAVIPKPSKLSIIT